MRTPRSNFKPKNEGVYLHVYNRTVDLGLGFYPFDARDKEQFKYIADKYLKKYNIELICVVIMSNHFHMLLHCPAEKMTQEQACKGYNQLHEGKFKHEVEPEDPRIQNVVENSNDISEYMRELQRAFSIWHNQSRPYQRKGTLWQDRFQCQLIQSDLYLWGCLKYIELNPVRAQICKEASEYKHSTFGKWRQTGSHPYQENFFKHIVKLAGKDITLESMQRLLDLEMQQTSLWDQLDQARKQDDFQRETELKAQLDLILAEKSQIDVEVIVLNYEKMHRSHYIGDKEFIREKRLEAREDRRRRLSA
jgi:REP element-mobilizing transposase RayT